MTNLSIIGILVIAEKKIICSWNNMSGHTEEYTEKWAGYDSIHTL